MPSSIHPLVTNNTTLGVSASRSNLRHQPTKPFVELGDQKCILLTTSIIPSSIMTQASSSKEVDINIKKREEKNTPFEDNNNYVVKDFENKKEDSCKEKFSTSRENIAINSKETNMDFDIQDTDTTTVPATDCSETLESFYFKDVEEEESRMELRNRLSRLKNAFYISTLCPMKEEPDVDDFTQVDVQIVDSGDESRVIESFTSDVHSLNSKLIKTQLIGINKNIINTSSYDVNQCSTTKGGDSTVIDTDKLADHLTTLQSNASDTVNGESNIREKEQSNIPTKESLSQHDEVSIQKFYSCDRDLHDDEESLLQESIKIKNNYEKNYKDVVGVAGTAADFVDETLPPTGTATEFNGVLDHDNNDEGIVASTAPTLVSKEPSTPVKVNRVEVKNVMNSPTSSPSFFKCKECCLYYKSKESYNFHMESTHGSETTALLNGSKIKHQTHQHSCKCCKALFTSSKRLLRHTTFIHGRRSVDIKCKFCGHAFLKRFYLKSHMRLCHTPLYDKQKNKNENYILK